MEDAVRTNSRNGAACTIAVACFLWALIAIVPAHAASYDVGAYGTGPYNSDSGTSASGVDGETGGARGAGTALRQAITALQQSSLGTQSSSLSVPHTTSSPSSTFDTSFTDVPSSSWFASYITELVSKGIVSGYADAGGRPLGLFGPANSVTYAEVAKMAILGAGLTPSDALPTNLSARNQWSASYIAEAEVLHLSPYTLSVNVNTPMSRAAALEAVLQAFQIPLASYKGVYKDVTAHTPYASAIATATNLGIVQGDSGADGKPTGTFRPNDPVNRAEFAKILTEVMASHGATSTAPAH